MNTGRDRDDVLRTPLLEFRRVTLGYGKKKILEDLRFTIHRGAFVGIVGPNGSGKTTLLRAAVGLLAPLHGEIVKGGGAPLRIGYVPQRTRLDPIFPLRVREVVTMGRYPHVGPIRRPTPTDREAVHEAAALVKIEDLLDRPYRDLSGGQQQRVLLARALTTQPDLLVLDEPTNGMDLPSEHAIVEVIRELHERLGTSVLFVTHLLHLVADCAEELVLLASEATAKLGQAPKVRAGLRDEILTESVLSEIYGVPVEVHDVGGRRIILPAQRIAPALAGKNPAMRGSGA